MGQTLDLGIEMAFNQGDNDERRTLYHCHCNDQDKVGSDCSALFYQSIQIHGWRLLNFLLRPRQWFGGIRSRRAALALTTLSATEEHASHHVKERVTALPGHSDPKPHLANITQRVTPEVVCVLQVGCVVLAQLPEQAGVAFLCRQKQQAQEIEKRDAGENA